MRIWQILQQPLLLIGVALLILILQLVAQTLPQMPGQFREDAVDGARWLLSTQERYGGLGPLIAGLGLFDFAHSFALRLLLALLTLLLLIQLGNLLALFQRMRHLPALLQQPSVTSGDPLPIPGLGSVYRRRQALATPPAQMAAQLEQQLRQSFPRRQAQILSHPQPVGDAPAETDPLSERRWLVLEGQSFLYLRLISWLGIGLALLISWLGVLYGWQVDPSILTPNSELRLPQRNLLLSYQVAPSADTVENRAAGNRPVLLVRLGDESGQIPVETEGQLRIGGVDVRSQPVSPALIVESWRGEARLAALSLPGQAGLVERLGFTFPTVGSEESILIPEAELGLRLVRLPAENRFLVEVVSSVSAQETQRTEISADDAIVVPYGAGDGTLILRIRYLPGLSVSARYQPAARWIWLALLLAIIGAAGFLRRPRFLLCQLAPWPQDRSVLVAQSDDPSVIKKLEIGE
ncbi:MAG: hypothetical protein KF893_10730 [Caldilineaceae bacterium]|nr:hypothetical protein [Caldilineaceae bacterium]